MADWLRRTALLSISILAIGRAATALAAPPADPLTADAELADVCFVDAGHGWAVGDRGAIWHTTDAGRHWRPQTSGVTCRLESVSFIDRENGWAVGGFTHPYTNVSVGVLLRTRDSGENWYRDPRLLLSRLHGVRFFSAARGWVWGECSPMFGAGLFTTENGGKTWSAMPGGSNAGWAAGCVAGPTSAIVGDRRGGAAVLTENGLESPAMPALGLRSARAIEIAESGLCWLVGDGGLILVSTNGGRDWQYPAGPPPEGPWSEFDWHAVAAKGDRVWVAGTPGTRVLYSPDAGRTWESFATGRGTPLKSLWFVDEHRGYAVGSLGTILATDEGGRSWIHQQSGGNRAAVLGLLADAKAAPLELFARLSGNEGYLGAIDVLTRRDLDPSQPLAETLAERTHDAAVGVGACGAETAWRFPARDPGLLLKSDAILAAWDGASGLADLESHLVRQIRMWRPEIVVTHAADPKGGDPLAYLVNQAVLQAVAKAAVPESHPEQVQWAGLSPWRVKRVFGAEPPGETGTISLNTSQVAARLGGSLASAASLSRGLLGGAFVEREATLGFRAYQADGDQSPSAADFMAGISLSPGDGARRAISELPAESTEALKKMVERHRNIQAILSQSRATTEDDRVVGEAAGLVAGLDESAAGDVLYTLGRRYHQCGRWSAAAETFELLATRYPAHPLAPSAAAWLVQYFSSGEAAARAIRSAGDVARQPGVELAALEGDLHSIQAAQAAFAAGRILPGAEGNVRLAAGVDDAADRAAQAAGWAERIRQSSPLVSGSPSIGFPLAASARARGDLRAAERFYLGVSRMRPPDLWWSCAEAERGLVGSSVQSPKPAVRTVLAVNKPRLDGRLDEPVWKAASPMNLASPTHDGGDWPAVALIAYDAEYLYLAATCRRAESVEYPKANGPRPRDAELTRRDRVDFLFDLDRDYVTCYRLTIDHRGWTSEACWGDKTWDPLWFVAADSGDESWTIEAAIPCSELTGGPPPEAATWAVGVQRIVPGIGIQSWTPAASFDILPEGFGHVVWEK